FQQFIEIALRSTLSLHDALPIFSTEDWQHFAEGLQAIFSTLHDAGLVSFNMILTETNDTSPVHARLIPRLTLGGLGTSDINLTRSEEHTSELQSRFDLVCRLLLA